MLPWPDWRLLAPLSRGTSALPTSSQLRGNAIPIARPDAIMREGRTRVDHLPRRSNLAGRAPSQRRRLCHGRQPRDPGREPQGVGSQILPLRALRRFEPI